MNQNTSPNQGSFSKATENLSETNIKAFGSTVLDFATFQVEEPDTNTEDRAVYHFKVDSDVKDVFLDKLGEFTSCEVGDVTAELRDAVDIPNKKDVLVTHPYYVVIRDTGTLASLFDIFKKLEEITINARKEKQ